MKALRCAVYTRKSSEEGLEQDFNSLHAQRDACEAYIRSQAGEGWTLVKTHYDDGGISGGTMERPALKALLADIAAGKVDIVVVYKVDRLTRSLTDFAKIVDVFDKRSVSFVSITQSFNTTSSMGRLTLNVLLSFAQFEREVTSERIRDKIAASKKKGLWMGGLPPLGYDPDGRTLKVNPAEAETVRHIFQRYLTLGSVHALAAELEAGGIYSKAWTTAAGKAKGGTVLRRGALYYLLTNRTYLGEIPHKDLRHAGQHPAIIDAWTFEAVREALAAATVRPHRSDASPAHFQLTGKIFDQDGFAMSPSTTRNRHGRRYRYYVSAKATRGPVEAGRALRLSAERLETLVAKAVADKLHAPDREKSWAPVTSVVIDKRLVTVRLVGSQRGTSGDDTTPTELVVRFPTSLAQATRGAAPVDDKQTSRTSKTLAGALRQAHDAIAATGVLGDGRLQRDGASPNNAYDRKLSTLCFLAPDIQSAIIAGSAPPHVDLNVLISIADAASWRQQRLRFFAPATNPDPAQASDLR